MGRRRIGQEDLIARPEPRVAEARWLADTGAVRALIDLSDGLAGDLGLDVENHLQGLLVHGHLRLQARQVEVVLNKVLRHLGKVLVPEQAAERRHP